MSKYLKLIEMSANSHCKKKAEGAGSEFEPSLHFVRGHEGTKKHGISLQFRGCYHLN